MIKKLVFLIAILAIATSLYTSSHWLKKGINVRDNILQQSKESSIFLQTTCNDVNLNEPPYNHNGVVMSGYLNVNKGGSGLAFFFYGKEGATKQQIKQHPIIIWLNGGPGSSSQLGNFMELGPNWVKPASFGPFEIVKNNHSWVKDYNVLFVDQPVGTGLSYADPSHPDPYCKNMTQVADDFYRALEQLYTNPNGCFHKLFISTENPLFIFGQSYAGKYAPAIGAKITEMKNKGQGFMITGLKGVAIGDGFTHPYDILTQVGQYAFNLGLIDYSQRMFVERIVLNATYQQRKKLWHDLHDSFDFALGMIVEVAGNINIYDITSYKDYPTSILDVYFEDPDIVKRFQINPQIKYGNQSANVYESLYEDFMKPYPQLVTQLLHNNISVLVYNGQNDLIVETPGTFKWVEKLHFKDAEAFRKQLLVPWKVNGKVAGFHKMVGKLELRTVNNAGHLVPMDQGENALHMVKSFVQRNL